MAVATRWLMMLSSTSRMRRLAPPAAAGAAGAGDSGRTGNGGAAVFAAPAETAAGTVVTGRPSVK